MGRRRWHQVAVVLMLTACAAPEPPPELLNTGLPVPPPQADGVAVGTGDIPSPVTGLPAPGRPALLAACRAARDAPTAGRASGRASGRAAALIPPVIERPIAGLAGPVRIDILPSHRPPNRGDCDCLIDLALRILDKPGLRLLARGLLAMSDPMQPITSEQAELHRAGVGPGSILRLDAYVDRVRTGCAGDRPARRTEPAK